MALQEEAVSLESDQDTDFSDDGEAFQDVVECEEISDEEPSPTVVVKQEVVDVENAARTDEPAAGQPTIEHAVDQPVVYNNRKYFKRKAGNAQESAGQSAKKSRFAESSELVEVKVDPEDCVIKSESGEEYQTVKQEADPELCLQDQGTAQTVGDNSGKNPNNEQECEIKVEVDDSMIVKEEVVDVEADTVKAEFENNIKRERLLKKLGSIRDWVYTRFGEDLRTGARAVYGNNLKLRLLTYNILSQSLLDKLNHPFARRPAFMLSWDYRLELLKREITSLQPDIICMQEVDYNDKGDVNEDLASFLTSIGFSFKGYRRPGSKTDGCAIFYRTEIFECDATSPVNLKIPQVPALAQANNCGIVCRLRTLRTGKRLVVGTLHLCFGKNRDVTRLAQMAVFLAEVSKLCSGGIPCIVAGDLNLQPFSDVHRLIVKGELRYRGLPCSGGCYPQELFPPHFENFKADISDRQTKDVGGVLSHNLCLRSVYNYRAERNLYAGFAPPESEVTAYQGEWRAVDHIFYSTQPLSWEYLKWESRSHDGKKEKQLRLLSKWRLPSASQMIKLGGLPSTIAPSDHLPLAADFLFSK